MAQITLIIMSFILMLAVLAYGRTRKADFDMLDASFLFIMLYFGVYSFIDAMVNEVVGKNALLLMDTFILIFIAIFATWLFYIRLPLRFRKVLQFDYLINQWVDVDHKVIGVFAFSVVAFSAYIYLKFGIIATYSGAELEMLGISAPTWIGPLKSLMSGIGFAVYIFIVASLLRGRIKILSIFTIVMFVMIAIIALEGRRATLELLLVAFIMWSCSKRKNVYSFKFVPYVVVLFILIILASNIYQTYRQDLFSIEGRIEDREISDLIPALENIDATIDNLKERVSMWNFNYMITSEQYDDMSKIFYGGLGWQALLNSIPTFFWKSKEVLDIDGMIANFYGFAVIDYPTNNFACFLADFGIFMIVAIPIIYLAVLSFVAYCHLNIPSKPLFLLVSTFCLQYLIKIENSYGDIFVLLRNVIFFIGLFFIANSIRHLISKSDYEPREDS